MGSGPIPEKMPNVESSSASETAAANAPAPARPCRNCGEPAPGRYCPACGQATETAQRGLREQARAAYQEWLAPRGRITLTLRKLLFSPGTLTVDYLEGRRARYLAPFRLYLWVSVLVLAAVQLLNLDFVLRVWGSQGVGVLRGTQVPVSEMQVQARWTPVEVIVRAVPTPGVARFSGVPAEEKVRFLRGRRARYLSSMLLVLVPAFAAMLALCFHRRHRRFMEHLVFAFHIQAFVLLAVLIESMFLRVVFANVVTWGMFAYFVVAARRVYGIGWVATVVRGAVAMAGYFALFYLANLALILLLISL
jgi:hypothetical protein